MKLDILYDYREEGGGVIRYDTDQNYTLRHSIYDYDVLIVEFFSHSTDVTLPDNHRSCVTLRICVNMLRDSFNPGRISKCSYDTRHAIYIIDGTSFGVGYAYPSNVHGTLRIAGIKY